MGGGLDIRSRAVVHIRSGGIANTFYQQTKRRRTGNGVKASPVVESSDDDVPLAKKAAQKNRKLSTPKATIKDKKSPAIKGDSSDSDIPLAAVKLAKEKKNIEKKTEKSTKVIRAEDKKPTAKANGTKRKTAIKDESDSDAPMKAKRAPAGRKSNGVKKEESSDDDVPLAKKAKPTPKKAVAAKNQTKKDSTPDTKIPAPKGKGKAKKEDTPADVETAEEEEEYKWWENQAETDGTQKWTTLEHNGVLFPPPYKPLPKNVKLKYGGVPVTLPPGAEEVAGFFGHMTDTPHAQNSVFTANFFKDFLNVVKETGGAKDASGKVRIVLLVLSSSSTYSSVAENKHQGVLKM